MLNYGDCASAVTNTVDRSLCTLVSPLVAVCGQRPACSSACWAKFLHRPLYRFQSYLCLYFRKLCLQSAGIKPEAIWASELQFYISSCMSLVWRAHRHSELLAVLCPRNFFALYAGLDIALELLQLSLGSVPWPVHMYNSQSERQSHR